MVSITELHKKENFLLKATGLIVQSSREDTAVARHFDPSDNIVLFSIKKHKGETQSGKTEANTTAKGKKTQTILMSFSCVHTGNRERSCTHHHTEH